MLDLLSLKFLLVLTYQVMRSLSGLKSVLHKGADALILLLLSLKELAAGILLLFVPPLLQLSFHFIIGERFLALLHASDVLKVLFLDPLELLDNRGIPQVNIVFDCHVAKFLCRPGEIQIHHVVQMLLSEEGLFKLLLDHLCLLASPCFLKEAVGFFGFIDHPLKIFQLRKVVPLAYG